MFGLVGALGTDLTAVAEALTEALAEVDYQTHLLRLSDHLVEVQRAAARGQRPAGLTAGRGYRTRSHPLGEDLERVSSMPLDKRYETLMDAGDRFRAALDAADALALLGVDLVRAYREAATGDRTNPGGRRVAYLLHQLKHPGEVERLRRVYGRSFVLLAAYAPREHRVRHLAERIAHSYHGAVQGKWTWRAEQLIARDEEGAGGKLGQNVRAVFPAADAFVDVSEPERMRTSLRRVVRLLFGYPVLTPTRDEQGMFYARAAAVRSASMARQVGAAVTTPGGDLLTVGTNEVPRAGGGLYWEGDKPDDRDFVRKVDVSDTHRRRLVADLMDRLKRGAWLSRAKDGASVEALVNDALAKSGVLKGAGLMDVMEFVRAVHAEMAAITDAARRGVALEGATLYVTTFPCHECARLIVASGIRRVVFIEPYAKSLAAVQYPDAIAVEAAEDAGPRVGFQPFVGVAPRRYLDLFEMREDRKTDDGRLAQWHGPSAQPRVPGALPLYVPAEQAAAADFEVALRRGGLRWTGAQGAATRANAGGRRSGVGARRGRAGADRTDGPATAGLRAARRSGTLPTRGRSSADPSANGADAPTVG